MSDLIVIVYPVVAQAEEVRKRLVEMHNAHRIALVDAIIATRTAEGRIKRDRLMNATAGNFTELFVQALFLNPLFGVSRRAAFGAVAGALTDIGVKDAFIKKLAVSLKPDNAMLFLLVKIMAADKVLKEIESFGGVVLKASLDETREHVLREAFERANAGEAAGAHSR